MNKKGIEMTLSTIVVAVLVLVVLGVLLYFAWQSMGLGKKTLELSPKQDALCLTKTQLMEKTNKGQMVDVDGDGRDDSCDWCICSKDAKTGVKQCSNKAKTATEGGDSDGDFLPDICDKADEPGKGRTIVEVDPDECKESNYYAIDAGFQCYITS